MPWNMQDYPASMKNLPELTRKKAIDIANALLQEGYEDSRAIPIATSQAEKWYEEASEEEKKKYKSEANPQKDDSHDTQSKNPDLVDNDVEVFYDQDHWNVQTKGAKRPASTYSTKKEAVERGKEIVKNKNSKLEVYKKKGSFDYERDPDNH